jgi:CheY-like chemotaxis protein
MLDVEHSPSASINQQSKISQPVSVTGPVSGQAKILKFEIEDTGAGMTPEQIAVIFRPFEQVGNQMSRMGGAGLGLAISRRLVHLMGGEIRVRSVFGQGSTFWFDLPVSVVQAGPHTIPAPERTVVGYRGPQQLALIVDNERTNRRVLTDLLLPVGFECVEAEHGLDALEKARARRPDVILLDWFMPIMNGFDTVRQLRQDPTLADVVVFAVSASAFDSDQARSLSAGCQVFLSKPVDARHLFQALETHLKLEWLYHERGADDAAQASRPESSCICPSHDEVERLHEMVLRGDLFGVQERAAALAQEDATFHPFATQLTQLAKIYQDEHLLTFLERCLKEERD